MNYRVLMALLGLAANTLAQRPATGPKGAEPDPTALGALKLLPKDASKNVARIEAREGNPWPARWYVLVFDPAEARGLREFAFADGKLVAARTLSQFADSLSQDDVIGSAAIKVNSDTATGIAGQFAVHNGVRLGSVNYELRKTGNPAVPVWRLTCLDPAGDQLGVIVIHAGKGTVTEFDGFQKAPFAVTPLPVSPVKTPAGAQKPAASAKVAPQTPSTAASGTASPKPAPPKGSAKPASTGTGATKPFYEKPTPKPGTLNRVGNSVRKIFGRGD